jgi:hypothetical protein
MRMISAVAGALRVGRKARRTPRRPRRVSRAERSPLPLRHPISRVRVVAAAASSSAQNGTSFHCLREYIRVWSP